VCEHHLLPFVGTAAVAYVPGDRVAGLGRFVRAVDLAAARPQMQERLTDDIAGAIERGLGARGALVLVRAEHTCVSARGTRTGGTEAVTVAARGSLATGAARLEALALMGCAPTPDLVETDRP
jgi:GTP cyclohydrolase I